MAKQYTVIVTSTQASDLRTHKVAQNSGDKGRALRIKAKAGETYQLVEMQSGQAHSYAPQNVKVKRVGNDLVITFEGGSRPDIVIEGYYDVMPKDHKGLIGEAEDGNLYEYIPEDPHPLGLVQMLPEGGQDVAMALGAGEIIAPAEAAIAAFPLLGLLGLGAAGAAAYVLNKDDKTSPNAITGALDANAVNADGKPNDSGTKGDNLTNDSTPTLKGTVPAGSTAYVKIKDVQGNVVGEGPAAVNPDGTWSFTQPNNLPDGVYTPEVIFNGGTPTPITPFTIDTVTNVDITNPGKSGATDPISGTAEAGDTVVIKDANGNVIGTTTAGPDGKWSLTPNSPLPAGPITATATDAAGNTATDTDTPSGNSSKTALTIDPITADNVILQSEQGAANYTVTGKVTGKYAAGDQVNLSLNGKTFSALVAADGSYQMVVPMADLLADPDTKIEGAVTGTGGDKATAAQDYNVEASNTPVKTALSINPVTADNIINAAENTGSIAITGKVTGKFSAGDTVTLTVNGKTFTGTAAADGSYSISVPAADLVADSDTLVNGTVTGTGGTKADAIQDYGLDAASQDGLKTALSINPITGDNIVLAIEQGAASIPVTGKVTGKFAAGDVVQLTLNGHIYTAPVAADGSYTAYISPADIKADPDTKIEGTVTGTGGDKATAAQDYTLESGNTPTQTALSLNPVTSDNILSPTEAAGTVNITGKVTGPFSPNDTVTVTVNGKPYTGKPNADGTFSIPVPGAELAADPNTTIEATITGTGGTPAAAMQDYGITNTTVADATGKLAPVSDNTIGTPNDNKTNDPTPVMTGTVPPGTTSAKVVLNGVEYPATLNPDGTWTAPIDRSNLPDGTYYPVLQFTTDGQTTQSDLTPFTIDTTPPTIAISADKSALATGQTTVVTFTFSEPVSDFVTGDIVTTGGTLSAPVQSSTDPKVWTATLTPTGTTPGTATVSVASGKFSDAAGNFNTDGADANNTLSLPTNAPVTGALQAVAPNDSGTLGDNLTNDPTPTITGKVPAGSTATVTINGQTYPVTVQPDGSYTFTQPTGLPDGTYVPVLNVTSGGVTSSTPVTPFTIDTTPPTIEVKADTSVLASGETAAITFILSEAVSDFGRDDIAVTGGTLSSLTQSAADPKVWTATFTPDSTGTSATISVASGKFSDAAANSNVDTATNPAPTGAVYESNNKVNLSTNAAVSGSLTPASDNATGVPNDNKTNDNTPELAGKVPAGSTATVTIDGVTYPVDVKPDGTWDFTQPTNLPDGTYTPILNVTKDGVTQSTPITPFTIDTTPPTVIVTADKTSLSAGQSSVVTFTLSEASTDFTLGDIAVTGGTLSNLQGSGTSYTATFTASTGSASVSVASNQFADAAGNLNKDGSETNNTWAFNNSGPTPTPDAATGALAPTSDSGVMGDNKTNDTTPELKGTVPPGSTAVIKIKNDQGVVVGEGPATVKPDGTWSFTQPNNLPDGVYTPEVIVNGGTPTPITPFVIDTTPPTIFIQADKTQLLAGQTTTVTFTLSEAVTDFAWNATTQTGDITVSGGTLGALTHVGVNAQGKDVYTATFTPTAGSTATSVIAVGNGNFSDAANNFNTDGADTDVLSNTNTLSIPTNTVTGGGTGFLSPGSDSGIPGDNITNDDTPTITGQVPPGSNASVNINGKDYPVTVNPDGTYSYTIPDNLPDGTYVPKIKVTPPGGGTPIVSDGTPFTIDTTPPTLLVISDKTSLTTGQTATITFTLSEDSKDFTLNDVTTTGGTLSNLQGSGKVYTATFTPSANSTTSTVKVDSLKFSDAAGNFNVDGADTGVSNTNIVSMATNTTVADTTAPTIAISADRATLATGQTTLVTFTLSEPSSDFTAADISTTGGTLGTLVQSTTDPKVYTAVFTPTANSTTTSVISVASNKFSDAAGNFNNDGADANNTVSLPTNTTPGLVTGGLDPKSDTGTPGDNKTLDNTPTISGTAPPGSKVDVVINGKTYPGVADENGQYSINVPDALPDGTYTPEIRVTPPGGPTSSTDGTPFTIDTTPPTIVVTSSATTLSAGQTATITFTLSEASTDFTAADVAVTGGTLSNFQGSGTSYTATFTPNANSIDPSVVHVASAKFADAAGNANTDGTDANNTVSMVTNTLPPDTTAPTIVVARTNPTASLKHGHTETITFTLSEASTDFNVGDITVTGGTLSNFTAIPSSGTAATGYTQYTATFTPTDNQANGSASVGVTAGKFKDNAGNANQDDYNLSGAENENNRVTFTYNTTTPDTTPPTVALSRTGTGDLTIGGSEVINIVLSEASKNFDLSDIVVTGGTLSGFAPVASSGNATTGYTDYVVTFTPTANTTGTATIGVAAGKFTDAANNQNADTYSATASNGTVTSPVVETNNIVSLGYNTTTPDTTAPTVAVSRSGLGTVSSTETIYFTLSEASTDFALDDVSVTGGQLSNFAPVASSGSPSTGYTQYQATFTPAANSSGLAAVGVVAGTFHDAAGNANKDTFESGVSGTVQEANNAVSFNVNTVLPDNTAPTVAVGRSGTGIVTGPETITFTLSEASTTFGAEDISVTGGTLSGFAPVATSGSAATGYTEYTAVFTPAAGTSGSATVGVASDKFSDAAGNYNKDTFVAGVAGTTQEVNNSVSFNYNSVAPDTTPPTIAIERLGTGTLSANASETIRFTISEATKDFTLADIVVLDASGNVINNALSNLAAVPTSGTVGTGYTTYVATFTALSSITPASGMVTIGVASGKFSDAAGNFNKDTYTNPATGTDVYEANNKVDISYNTLTPSNDTTPPTVIVARAGSATLQTGGSETITFTLSEPSLTFDSSDITVTGGGTLGPLTMVSSSGTPATGYTVYTATYTPPANTNSTTTIGVLSGKFSDAAGNLNKDTYASGVLDTSFETNNVVSVAYNTTAADTTAPKVEVLRSASGTITGPETIYFNFSEAINPGSFTTSDIVATGGTISNLVPVTGSNNTQFIATFTPNATSTGTATIGVGASAVTDVAGNANTDTYDLSSVNYEANNQVSASYDTLAPNPIDETPPTVAISRVGTGLVGSTGETLVFVFSEPVNGFTAGDIVVTANGSALPSNQGVLGTVTEVAGSGGTQYTVSYTAPTGTVGSVTLGIKAGTFTDRATTPNANKDTYEANVANTVQEANNQLTLAWDNDTTSPTVVVTSSTANGTTLATGQTSTITFTLSEASADFTQSDVTVTGGTLSNWTHSTTNPLVYTATFTPTPNNSGTATIGVKAGTFNDLGGNINKDTYDSADTFAGKIVETDNKVDIAFNTLGATFVVNNDTGAINEDATAALTGNVKTNDSLVATITSVSQGGTSGTLGTALTGTYGSLTLNADGSYSYVIDNTKPAVQALKAGQTVTEVFSYTGANTGATQSGSANLTITITGTNDAPVAVADTATAVETGGSTASPVPGTNPSGNVLTNDTDVDTGDTRTVSAILAGTTGTATSVTAATASAATGIAGTYGTLKIGTDGSYSYVVDNANANVQALLPSSTALTDTFTYTVRDAAGATHTHTHTLTVSITGANDAPQVQVPLVDQTVAIGSALFYTWPGNANAGTDTFRDVDTGHQAALTYTASLADGSSLPAWLSFNATTRTFSGSPPAGTTLGDITVKVTATDALGLSTSDDFRITIAAAPAASLKTAITIDPVTGDNVILSTENTGNITVTGKVSGAFATTDTVTVTINDQVLTTTPDANGNYSVSVAASDLAADTDTKIEATVTGTGGSTATAAQDYVLEASTTPTQTALVIDKVTADNIVNATEGAGSVNITGKVTGKYASGDTVTLMVNGKSYTGTALADGSYTIAVAGSDLLADADTTIDGIVTGTGGTTARAAQNYGVDTSVPTNASSGLNLGIRISTDADDDKLVSTAELNSATDFTSVITFDSSKAVAGDTVVVTATNGTGTPTVVNHVLTAAEASAGTFSLTFAKPAEGQLQTVTANYVDKAGNAATDTPPTDNAKLDTTAPTNADVGLAIAISTDSGNDGKVSIAELNGAPTFTSRITVNNTAQVGDQVIISATNGGVAQTPITHTLTANDISNGFDVTFAKPADGATQVVTANYVDAAGNAATDTAPTDSASLDATRPTITISSSASTLTVGQTATITFTVSEAGTDFNWNGFTGDITLTGGGSLSALSAPIVTAGQAIYTATYTPPANTTASANISVASDKFNDASGNANRDGADPDNSVLIAINTGSAPSSNASATIDITTIVEPNVSIDSKDTGASATDFITQDQTLAYKGTITNWVDGQGDRVMLQLYKTVSGSPVLQTTHYVTPSSTGAWTWNDIATTRTDGTYTLLATIVSSSGTTAINSTAPVDPGNGNLTGGGYDQQVVIIDNAASNLDIQLLTLRISTDGNNDGGVTATELASASTFTSRASFDGTKAKVGEKLTFTASNGSTTLTPIQRVLDATDLANGYVDVTFAKPAEGETQTVAVKFTDLAGNLATDTAPTDNAKLDSTPPTIAISASPTTVGSGQGSNTSLVTFTLSEASSDFAWNGTSGDVTVTGGMLSALTKVSDTVYTATFTPDGTATSGSVSVASGTFSDTAGNQNADGNDANNTQALTINLAPVRGSAQVTNPFILATTPEVTITDNVAGSAANGSTVTYTLTFSEAIDAASLDIGDLTITNGTLVANSLTQVNATTWTVQATLPATAGVGTQVLTLANGSYTSTSGVAGTGSSVSQAYMTSTAIAGPSIERAAGPAASTPADGWVAGVSTTDVADYTKHPWGYQWVGLNGTSSSGGLFAFGYAGPSLPETLTTTLTGLTVGQTYTYGLDWQQVDWIQNGSAWGAVSGGLSIKINGVEQIYTSNYSSNLTDTWQKALYTFTATSTTATLEAGVYTPGTKAAIVFDSLTTTAITNSVNEARILTGTANADTNLIGADGNDTITGAGGADTIVAGGGNDVIILNSSNISALSSSLIDGGSGINTLRLADTGSLDLTDAAVLAKVRGIHSIDITGTGNNTLKLDVSAVAKLANTADVASTTSVDESKMLVVNGNSGDSLQLAGTWTAGTAVPGSTLSTTYGSAYGFVAGTNYTPYTLGGATVFVAAGIGITYPDATDLASQGVTIDSLFGSTFSDPNTVSASTTVDDFVGVAIIGAGSSGDLTSKGKYQYSSDGTTWTDLPTDLSISNAFFAKKTDRLRFVQPDGVAGVVPQDLTVHLVDGYATAANQTTGARIDVSTNGGMTAYSDDAVTLADKTAPTIAISASPTTVGSGQGSNTSLVTFTLSEASTTFDAGDVVTTGGTLSGWSGSGTTYSAVFTPTTGQTSGTVSVASNKFSDAAGNFNTDGAEANNTATIAINVAPVASTTSLSNPLTLSTGPEVTITDNVAGSASNGQTVTYTLTFSEAISAASLTESDLSVNVGSLVSNSLTKVNDTTWTVQATVPATGVAVQSLTVANGSYTSTSGTAGMGGVGIQAYGTATTVGGPEISGAQAQGVVPSGWTMVKGSPDILDPTTTTHPWATSKGNMEGTSLNGNTFAAMSTYNSEEQMGTTLTGLTPGQTYTFGVQWQQIKVTGSAVGTERIGGSLLMTVNGTSQLFTSSGVTDSWQTATMTFVATGTTASVVLAGENTGATGTLYNGIPLGFIGVDSLTAAQITPGDANAGLTLTGTTAADTNLIGADGNDTITAAGGADNIYAGGGNDVITLNTDNVAQLTGAGAMVVDGGSGINRLVIANTTAGTATAVLDLTKDTTLAKLRGINTIDITGPTSTATNNTVKLDYNAVTKLAATADVTTTAANESKMVLVQGNAGDTLQLAGTWTAGASTTGSTLAATYGSAYGFVSGTNYTAYTLGDATVFVASTMTVSNNQASTTAAGTISSQAVTIESLFGPTFSDANTTTTIKDSVGVAITSAGSSTDLSSKGKYQISTNGGTSWVDLAAGLTDATSIYADKTALIRFVEASGVIGAVPQDLTVRLVDGYAVTANHTTGGTVNVSTNGGMTAYSGNTVTLSQTPVQDTTAPGIAVSSSANTLGVGQTATITFSLSEPSTTFDANDVTVSGGTLSNFQGSGNTYTATFTPTPNTASGSATISVASGKFTDAAGNANADGAEANNTTSITYDTVAPVFSSAATSALLEGQPTATEAYNATADGDVGVTYTLSGTDAALFDINPSTGVVTFKTTPVYATPTDSGANNVYDVVVTATDATGNATNQNVAITVVQQPTLNLSVGAASGAFATSPTVSGGGLRDWEPKIATTTDGGYVVVWRKEISTENYKVVYQKFDASHNKVGSEVEVSGWGSGGEPQVTAMADGGFVIVSGNGSQNLYVNRYNSSNTLVSSTTLNPTNTYNVYADVTVLNDGGYVVSWTNLNDIYVQRFSSANALVGTTKVIDGASTSDRDPLVVATPDNGYVVVWSTSNPTDIFVQKFGSDNNPVGSEVALNNPNGGTDQRPDVTVLKDGSYVVTWEWWPNNGDGNVYVQKFNSNGTTAGSMITLSGPAANVWDKSSSVTALNDGGYVVAWSGYVGGTSTSDLFIQRYDKNNALVGTMKQVQGSDSSDELPEITATTDGGYVVVWHGMDVATNQSDVYAQKYDASNNPVGPEQRLSGVTNGGTNDHLPQVTALPNGGYAVTWYGSNPTNSATDIFVEAFDGAGVPAGSTGTGTFNITSSLSNLPVSETVTSYVATYTGGTLTVGGTAYASGATIPKATWDAAVAANTVLFSNASATNYSFTLVANVTDSTTGLNFQVTVNKMGTGLTSPLVIDLNGDGVQTLGLDHGVVFDLSGTGQPVKTAWVDHRDGLLAIDRNHDGQINSGVELFGTGTVLANGAKAADGWAALAGLDTNADGVINAMDAQFADLRVWRDADGDGVTDAGELVSLQDAGIVSISLAHDQAVTAQNGNLLIGQGAVTHTNGTTTQVTDAWLATEKLSSVEHPMAEAPALDGSLATLNLVGLNDVQLSLDNLGATLADLSGNAKPDLLHLNVSDVLQLQTTATGVHQLEVLGDANDVVDLSSLFADGHAEGQWQQGGQVTQNGHTFNVYQYSGDQSLQVLIDQHIVQSNVHLS